MSPQHKWRKHYDAQEFRALASEWLELNRAARPPE